MFAAIPLVVVIAGCNADSDGDGLTNKEELELGLDPESADSDNDGLDDAAELAAGSDPLVADTDGDGLTDGEEAEAGSDPTIVDTDADGYTDRDEVHEGHDPNNANDVIYKGGWPYVFGKTELTGGANYDTGKRFKQFNFKDQFGDDVDLWDFYNEDGKHVVIDISAGWCPPCNDMAAWLEGESVSYLDPISNVRDAVDNGDIWWVTILGDGWTGPAGKPEATEWYNLYPNPHVPVLADKDQDLVNYVSLQYWPTTILLGPDLKVISKEDGIYAASDVVP